MGQEMNEPRSRVILIGGTSNVGKSTLAQSLAATLGWQCVSTDTLARHPGRPWGEVASRPHVAEHYLSLAPDELLADVLRHYANLWPNIERLITTHASDPAAPRLILEGSALWPESVATLHLDGVAAVWLTAGDRFLQQRIHTACNFDHVTPREQAMIEKFLARTQRYNERMMQSVRRLGLPWLDVEPTAPVEDLTQKVLTHFALDADDASAGG
jgi:2-phosphoglycerate kinase